MELNAETWFLTSFASPTVSLATAGNTVIYPQMYRPPTRSNSETGLLQKNLVFDHNRQVKCVNLGRKQIRLLRNVLSHILTLAKYVFVVNLG